MIRSPAPAPRSHPAWTIALTSVAFFMVNLDFLVVITALPRIGRDLGANLDTLQWTINAYSLAWAAAITTAAALGDRFGRRRVFTIGLAVFFLSSAACALAPNGQVLILARVFQGAGAGIIMPLSLTILTSAFPPERRGAMVGIWGGLAGIAVAAGPLIGGAVTQGLSWQWIFWVNVPIGIVALVLALIRLPESKGVRAPLDLPGVVLVSTAAVAIIFGLVRGPDVGWSNLQTILSLGLGAVLLVSFVLWELRAASPTIPMDFFRNATFSAANATGFFMIGSLTAAAFLVAQYFQIARGESPLDAGLHVLPWTVTPLVVAPLAGALSDRIGRRPLLVTGTSLQGAGFLLFAAAASSGFQYWPSILALVVAGIGISMALPVAPTAIVSAVAPVNMGKASAVNSMLQRFGSAFGVAVATAVVTANGGLESPAAFTAGFRPALVVVGGLSLLGALSALCVPGRSPRPLASAVPAAVVSPRAEPEPLVVDAR
jgi:EmrB/QacA subfamily drug resistance transporter